MSTGNILFFDTETSGIPVWNKPSEDPCQPRIFQLTGLLCDADCKRLCSMDMLIKPEGWTIPEEIVELTGCDTARCEQGGVPIAWALPMFMQLWRACDFRVAHNESFDMRMVRIELMRSRYAEHADAWKAGKSFCTQGKSTRLCNLPPTEKMMAAGRKTGKAPTLAEAFRHFTGKELGERSHNAMYDVLAVRAVYLGIVAAGGG